MTQLLTFDGQPLTIEDVGALSRRQRQARLSTTPAFLGRIEAGAAHVARTLREHGVIYGVTTGYGDSVTTPVPPELVPELGHRLFTYHGVGLGPAFGLEE